MSVQTSMVDVDISASTQREVIIAPVMKATNWIIGTTTVVDVSWNIDFYVVFCKGSSVVQFLCIIGIDILNIRRDNGKDLGRIIDIKLEIPNSPPF